MTSIFKWSWPLFALLVVCCQEPSELIEINYDNPTSTTKIIPVESFEGEPLDSAELIINDEIVRIRDKDFNLFSLKFKGKHSYPDLSLHNKLLHQSVDQIIIGSSRNLSMKNKKLGKFRQETLIAFESDTLGMIHSMDWTFGAPLWSAQYKGTEFDESLKRDIHKVLVMEKISGRVSSCIFFLDSDIGIVKIQLFKLDPDKIYL